MECDTTHGLAFGLAVFAYSLIEFFIGRRRPYDCGSALELLFVILVPVVIILAGALGCQIYKRPPPKT